MSEWYMLCPKCGEPMIPVIESDKLANAWCSLCGHDIPASDLASIYTGSDQLPPMPPAINWDAIVSAPEGDYDD